jgi:Methylase involved in ubiquinone/menaquinone biosynthesis
MVDWVNLRQNVLNAAHRTKFYDVGYWDKEAGAVNKNVAKLADLTEYQVKMLPLSPEVNVLDVGAGTGRMTLPIAKKVRHVTALEPSENMLGILQENARQQQLFNINYINKPLEEIGSVSSYDLVVASYSLFMYDLEKALLTMNQLASKSVYLFMSASPWIDEGIQTAVYESPNLWSDFILTYNILHYVGIVANAEICTYTFEECYPSVEDATESFIQKYSLPLEKRRNLTEHLRANLVEEYGGFYYKRKMKVATIWWNTNK